MATNLAKEVDDITECPICAETYDVPKLLPCGHTFCCKCLERCVGDATVDRVDGSCPLCRHTFTIPLEGIARMPGNVLIAKLVDIRRRSEQPVSGRMCKACSTEHESDADKVAEWFCVNCNEDLCSRCSKSHQKSKSTKFHRVEKIESKQLSDDKSSYCQQHSDKQIELYCNDCKQAICDKCFTVSHKMHQINDIDSCAKEAREEVQKCIDKITEKTRYCLNERDRCRSEKEMFLRAIIDIKSQISNVSKELIVLVNAHADTLLSELTHMKRKTVDEFEMNEKEIENQLALLENFATFSREILEMTTVSGLARVSGDLNLRAKDMCTTPLITSMASPYVLFSPQDIVTRIGGENMNVIGVITVADYNRGL